MRLSSVSEDLPKDSSIASPSCLFQHRDRKIFFLFNLNFSCFIISAFLGLLALATENGKRSCLEGLAINEHLKASLPLELTRKSHGSFPQRVSTLVKETTHMKLCLELQVNIHS